MSIEQRLLDDNYFKKEQELNKFIDNNIFELVGEYLYSLDNSCIPNHFKIIEMNRIAKEIVFERNCAAFASKALTKAVMEKFKDFEAIEAAYKDKIKELEAIIDSLDCGM